LANPCTKGLPIIVYVEEATDEKFMVLFNMALNYYSQLPPGKKGTIGYFFFPLKSQLFNKKVAKFLSYISSVLLYIYLGKKRRRLHRSYNNEHITGHHPS